MLDKMVSAGQTDKKFMRYSSIQQISWYILYSPSIVCSTGNRTSNADRSPQSWRAFYNVN